MMRQPNFIVFLTDDQGYGDLSCMGADDFVTPHLDRMADEGARFTCWYSNSPVCSPSRASLLTGRYPGNAGVRSILAGHRAATGLPESTPTIATALKSLDYQTYLSGKWHLGLEAPNRPTDRGFDLFHGYLGDMMDDYYKHRRHGINYMRMGTREIDPLGHATDLFTDWACDYLRGRTRKKAPFFLYLAYNAPHTPIQPPEEWVEKVLQREKGIDPARARLVALIEHMDDGIGKVMETISKTDLASNTLVIFTSDNGGQLSVKANNGPLRDGKQSMYEGGLKVPACAVWPDKIAPGSHSDRLAITMDLFATICDVAGVSVKHTIEGRSILPTLLGTSQAAEDRDLFFHRREGGERYGGLTIHAIRRGEWKLLQNSPFAPMELYNLTQDPAERNDLANDNRKVYREMLSALRVQIQRGGAVPWQRPARRDVK